MKSLREVYTLGMTEIRRVNMSRWMRYAVFIVFGGALLLLLQILQSVMSHGKEIRGGLPVAHADTPLEYYGYSGQGGGGAGQGAGGGGGGGELG